MTVACGPVDELSRARQLEGGFHPSVSSRRAGGVGELEIQQDWERQRGTVHKLLAFPSSSHIPCAAVTPAGQREHCRWDHGLENRARLSAHSLSRALAA